MSKQFGETSVSTSDLRLLVDAEIDLVNGGSFWADLGRFIVSYAAMMGGFFLGFQVFKSIVR